MLVGYGFYSRFTFCVQVEKHRFTFRAQVEKQIHQHFASARTYGKKKEFFALSVKQVDCFYTRIAQELAGCDPNTHQPKSNSKKRKEAESDILKAVLQEQAAQRVMLERLLVGRY